MSKRVKVHVGTAKDMGQRFVSAWHRLEGGEKVRERHVTFPNLPSMLNALTPKRLELLQDVHREPASSVKALAERLGRDRKSTRLNSSHVEISYAVFCLKKKKKKNKRRKKL